MDGQCLKIFVFANEIFDREILMIYPSKMSNFVLRIWCFSNEDT